MSRRVHVQTSTPPLDLGRGLVEAFLANERVNQVLLELLDPAVWRAFPTSSPRRNIATSFAHIHNVRCMKVKMSGGAPPPRLDRGELTRAQASKGLAASARAMAALIARCVAAGGKVPGFRPGVAVMVTAAVNHEAHHRGQVCHWARELGAPIGPEQALRLWDWDRHWRAVVGG
ncbi:MAG TPA: DinB family protein [Planctomycetota bacterium]|nr:DinB family protein [Planctomycetota bacterium]